LPYKSKTNCHEETKVHRGADHLRPQAVRDRYYCSGGLPQDVNLRGHPLQPGEKIRWFRRVGFAKAAATGGGEPAAGAAGGGPESGQADAAGCAAKKL